MQVKDLMKPVENNSLSPELTLYEAVCTMRKSGISQELPVNGMVVLEHGLKLVGVVSIKDIIRAVIPPYMENNLRGFAWDGMLEEYIQKARTIRVADIMSKNLVTVGADASLMQCADLMIDKYLQRLPVVDGSGRVLGVVHISHLYSHIADIMCSVEGP